MLQFPDPLPSLETRRLLLRPLTLEDFEFVFQHFRDDEVSRYLLDEEPVTGIAQAQAIIEFYLHPGDKTYSRWGIARQEDGKLIGTCGYHRWDKSRFRAEIGYDLSPACWGQGLMQEGLHALLRFGFEQMQLNRVEALVYVENDRSIRVLQRLGFQREGLLRDYFYLNGQFYDHYVYSLLRRESNLWNPG